MSPDGKTLDLTGTDADKTSLEVNRWLDNAYSVSSANSAQYTTVLNKIIRRRHVQAIFPQPDPEVGRLSRDRAILEAAVFLPDPPVVTVCLDKFESLQKWADAKLRGRPVLLARKEDALENRVRSLGFPTWIRARHGAGGLLSCLAKDWKQARYWLLFHWGQGFDTDFVAEEYLPGRDFCFMSIWDKGNLVTSMARERLSWVGNRSVGTGGTSKLNRVVHDDKVNHEGVEAIRAVSQSPHGIFCVDLKQDTKGVPRPTEINCRFTTNVHYLTLASIKLGSPEMNFPWLAGRLSLQEDIPKCNQFNALPSGIWFTKNTDMGFAMVEDDKWRAATFS